MRQGHTAKGRHLRGLSQKEASQTHTASAAAPPAADVLVAAPGHAAGAALAQMLQLLGSGPERWKAVPRALLP
jgi:hypothetical protein